MGKDHARGTVRYGRTCRYRQACFDTRREIPDHIDRPWLTVLTDADCPQAGFQRRRAATARIVPVPVNWLLVD